MAKSFTNLIYVWTSIMMVICFILGMLGLASPAWRSGSFSQGQWVDSGLIMQCHHEIGKSLHHCAPFSLGSQTVWFEVSRVFCTVSIITLVPLLVSCAFLQVVDKKREDYGYPLGFSIITGILGTVGAIVYAMESEKLYPEFQGTLSWGWAVYISSVLIIIITSCCLIAAVIKGGKRKPKLQQIFPQRDLSPFYS